MATMETTRQEDTNILKAGLQKTVGVLNDTISHNRGDLEVVQPEDTDIMEDACAATIGYISIKDYAYEDSNPLHYGYFDGDHEEDEAVSDSSNTDDGYNKRQSITLPDDYIVNQRAVALYDFEPENDNELKLTEGDTVFISYKHGQGWLVAENESRSKTGLVPEEFVSYIQPEDGEDKQEDTARPFYLTHLITQSVNPENSSDNDDNNDGDDGEDDDEWEDIDDVVDVETDVKTKLKISN
ncbi:nbp2p [Saccharomyces arboricola H-6]|uniref:Nbp2p n=1 Tax=Saccharomyces arboricola (strain H-6 / AS 2.3317 / CBS 10644) TaxID=1160507 RepID=J8PJN1_SACAR|nr:nbp2p [Saccharomyces arboricola H-6]